MPLNMGSDPEFFLVRDGVFASAIGVIGKDKTAPIEISGNKFYYDNVLSEIAICPGSSVAEVVKNTRKALEDCSQLVWPYFLARIAWANFPNSQLQHPDARKVGCKTEWCAYDITEKIGPIESITKGNKRTAGGHIHLSGSPMLLDGQGQLAITRMLDLFLAIPMVLIHQSPDETLRRRLYGYAGRHRHPSHGLEYRTLSNHWLSSPQMVELTYELCSWVVEFVENDGHKEWWTLDDNWINVENQSSCHHCTYDTNKLRECIDTNDPDKVWPWLHQIRKKLPDRLDRKITAEWTYSYQGLYKEWGI